MVIACMSLLTLLPRRIMKNFKLTGESLEFGFSDVIFDMEEGSWTLPNGTAYYGSSLWAIPSLDLILYIP